MTRLRSLLAFLLIATAFSGCSAQPYEFNESSVESIISTLADDDMRGRSAFSPDAMRAADYIASHFQKIGLQTFDGDNNYLQEFTVYSVEPEEVAVSLDGAAVGSDRIAAALSAETVSWSGAEDALIVNVGADDDLFAAWRAHRSGNTDVLMTIHSEHADQFGRLQRFLARPSRTLSLDGGANLVMVLTRNASPESFSVHATSRIEQLPLANVVGTIPGNRKNEFVLFSAHYDHIGIRNTSEAEADSIANGANDNASGTTAVIELARYFASRPKPERSIVFAAFTAEEAGGYGSRYFSEQLDPDRIVAMFNIEMIGKPAVEGPNTAWITGFDRSSFGEILQQAVEGTQFQFYADPYPDQNLFYRSDNATLARVGVPAHTISTTPIDVDPDYHQVSDEVDTLNLSHLTNTIRAIAAGARTIISGEATPTRVDPASF